MKNWMDPLFQIPKLVPAERGHCILKPNILIKHFSCKNQVLMHLFFSGDAMASQMLPHFRLLSKCTSKQHNGDVDEIDAVLGCPLWMPSNENLDEMSPQELNYACDILFYCYNWFRELINTFNNSTCNEDQRKVTIRLKNMVQLEKELKSILAYNSQSYIPPMMLHMENVSGWHPPGNNTGEPKAKKGEVKAKGLCNLVHMYLLYLYSYTTQ